MYIMRQTGTCTQKKNYAQKSKCVKKVIYFFLILLVLTLALTFVPIAITQTLALPQSV